MKAKTREDIMTRTFGLELCENSTLIPQDIFSQFQSCVALFIRHGIWLNESYFKGDGLVNVKKFYNHLIKKPVLKKMLPKMSIRERLRRCAAQPAYFMIREQKRRAGFIGMMADYMLEDLDYVKILSKRKLPAMCYTAIKQRVITDSYQSYVFFDNLFRQLRNILKDILKKKIQDIPLAGIEIDFSSTLNFKDYYSLQLNRFCKSMSRILTKRVNALNKGHGLSYGGGKFDSILEEIFRERLPSQIEWQRIRFEWIRNLSNAIMDNFDQNGSPAFEKNVLSVLQDRLNPKHLVNLFFKPKKSHTYIRSADLEGFIDYLKESAVLKYEQTYLESIQNALQLEIKKSLQIVSRFPLDYLGKPQFKKNTIPLGIDDGQVYSLTITTNEQTGITEQIIVDLSFKSHLKHSFRITDVERFHLMIEDGFQPKRGTISKRFGLGYDLAIPFSKSYEPVAPAAPALPIAIEELDSERVGSVDLGLKVFGALGIENVLKSNNSITRDNVTEIARYFIDQYELIGSKDEWFSRDVKPELIGKQNIKRRLLNLRTEVRSLQKKIANLKNTHRNNYRHKVKYRKLHSQWRFKWNKIHNIHEELGNQIATRIVAVFNFHQVDVIKVEDLSWSRPSNKQKTGYFLSTWQVHWFFSKIQEKIETIAHKFGMKTLSIDPQYTSQRCSRCGRRGNRIRKVFTCPYCGFSLDSDLNASREIAIVDLSPIATGDGGGSPLPPTQ